MSLPDALVVEEIGVIVVVVVVVLRLFRDCLAAKGRYFTGQFARDFGNGGEAEGEQASRIILGRGVQKVRLEGRGRETLLRLMLIFGELVLGHDC